MFLSLRRGTAFLADTKTGATVWAKRDLNAPTASAVRNCDSPALKIIAPLVPDVVVAVGRLLIKVFTAGNESRWDTGGPFGADAAISVS